MSKKDERRPKEWSIAMTEDVDLSLRGHLDKGADQEDLAFAYWRESTGEERTTAVIHELALPRDGERILEGNVAFTGDYLLRVLAECPAGSGIVFLHSHLGPGWQDMSSDDEVAERDRLAGAVMGRTGLPVVGMTLGTDGTWSGRTWIRDAPNRYLRQEVASVRVVGAYIRPNFHPDLRPIPRVQSSQEATLSVWGAKAQADLARTRFGVVGLGNVGSIVSEALSRLGVQEFVLIDHDHIEQRNLDRTLGAVARDADLKVAKVHSARRLVEASHTAATFNARAIPMSLLDPEGYRATLDCDVLFSCVDRPWPRHVLNLIAYSHLIPVVDGGIFARVTSKGTLLHADWRVHAVGPGRPCMVCIGALRRSDVALDREGKLEDPEYIQGLPAAEQALLARRNVFPFGLSVAAHEVIQAVAIASGLTRLGGTGPQHYACYPGVMTVDRTVECKVGCEFNAATATVVDAI